LDDILEYCDYVLLMSVNPGFGGQSFIANTLDKARKLNEMIGKKNNNKVFVEMDGGIGIDNIKSVGESGVNVFVCGNSIFGSSDPAAAIKEMKKIISKQN
jgi:ribulose-phosphate 3-epimerase